MAVTGETALTIDDLSRCAGLSVRNVRAYQARGLLPRPVRRGRTAYYDQTHVERLELIRALRADGFNLAAIRTLVAGGPEFIEKVQRLRTALDPVTATTDPWVPLDDESIRLIDEYRPGTMDRFIELGTVRRDADGTLLTPESILREGWTLNRLGASPAAIIELTFVVARQARQLATSYVEFLQSSDWRLPAGAAPDVDRLRGTYTELQPVTVAMISTLFELALAKAIWRDVEEYLSAGEPGEPSEPTPSTPRR